jgi:hypothetical protein
MEEAPALLRGLLSRPVIAYIARAVTAPTTATATSARAFDLRRTGIHDRAYVHDRGPANGGTAYALLDLSTQRDRVAARYVATPRAAKKIVAISISRSDDQSSDTTRPKISV